ncbi:hypothetical protein LINPERHAP1_LOCUS32193 [Linum perenne]
MLYYARRGPSSGVWALYCLGHGVSEGPPSVGFVSRSCSYSW